MNRFARQFKMNFPAPKEICLNNDYPNSYCSAIIDNVDRRSTNMIVCMLTRKNNGYDQIKVLCCKELGIPSQCVMAKSMKNPKRLASISSKIVQQINCKVGGELWHVQVSFFFLIIYFYFNDLTLYKRFH